ncbi:MAG TPA: type II toxin-antitoxin system RelE/ParE family toxin [Candidatus Cybelea sp.]
MRLSYQELAQRDLVQIWLICTENAGLATADKLIDRIKGALARTVTQFPESGRRRIELGADVRSVVVLPYVIFYRVARSRVEVLRVIHGHRDIKPPLVSLLLAA